MGGVIGLRRRRQQFLKDRLCYGIPACTTAWENINPCRVFTPRSSGGQPPYPSIRLARTLDVSGSILPAIPAHVLSPWPLHLTNRLSAHAVLRVHRRASGSELIHSNSRSAPSQGS